ncbi:unnamed protein product [Amoebophrya sp. A25]|nr:unnamed protein product [Amoebophrya sp. A25]|eukprot:GSA25T00007919001.1
MCRSMCSCNIMASFAWHRLNGDRLYPWTVAEQVSTSGLLHQRTRASPGTKKKRAHGAGSCCFGNGWEEKD